MPALVWHRQNWRVSNVADQLGGFRRALDPKRVAEIDLGHHAQGIAGVLGDVQDRRKLTSIRSRDEC